MHTRFAYALAVVFVICGAAGSFAALHQPSAPMKGDQWDRQTKFAAKPEPLARLMEPPEPRAAARNWGPVDCTVIALVDGTTANPAIWRQCLYQGGLANASGPVWFGPRS